jgi:hypothetical protein
VLGIRPVDPGFGTVEIRPQLGRLTYARGTLVHPRGEVVVDINLGEDGLHGRVSLPAGVRGRLQLGERYHAIDGGTYEF